MNGKKLLEKAIPLPLKAVWYSPAKIWLESPLVFISIFLTFFNNALVLIYGISTVFRISVIMSSEVIFSASAS